MKCYVICGNHRCVIARENYRFAAMDALAKFQLRDEPISAFIALNERGFDSPPETGFDTTELLNEMVIEDGED